MNSRITKQYFKRYFGSQLQLLGYSTGLMRLTNRLQNLNGAVILMYHSVADSQNDRFIDPDNHISPDIFDRQMKYISQKKNIISLNKLLIMMEQEEILERDTVIITFDDGYLDNLTVAAPILEKYNLEATLFLPTGYIDRGESQWIDQIYTLIKYRTINNLEWNSLKYNLNNKKEERDIYLILCNELMIARIKKRDEILAELSTKLQPATDTPKLTMTWDDIRLLLKKYNCFEIGGHTKDHIDLTGVSLKEAKNELDESARRIKEELSLQPDFFSFCYGRTSDALRNLCSSIGYKAACGNVGIDPIVRTNTDFFCLPRIAAPDSITRFVLDISSYNSGIWRKLRVKEIDQK